MNQTDFNQSLSTASLASNSSKRDIFILVLYLITAVVAMVGNAFICSVIYKKRWLKSTTYILIFSMAISDIMGGFVIPAQWLFCSTVVLDSGNFGAGMCGLMKTLQMLSYYGSSLTMTAIAYDRFRLVCRPMRPRANVAFLLAISWGLGLLFISGNFFTLRVSEYFSPTKGLITCRVVFLSGVGIVFRKVRSLTLLITQYIIPLGLTTVFYSMVMHRIWSREQLAGSNCTEKKQAFDEKKKRTIIMLIVVTVLFGLSYIPTHVFHILMFYTRLIPVKKNTCYSSTAYMLSYWLGISSCAYNPFIYCYFNAEFRNEAFRWFQLVINCGRDPANDTNPSNEETGGPNSTDSNISSKQTDCSPNNSVVAEPPIEMYRKVTEV